MGLDMGVSKNPGAPNMHPKQEEPSYKNPEEQDSQFTETPIWTLPQTKICWELTHE